MTGKNIKPAAAVMILYLLLTAGLWMFLYCLEVSGGHITGETKTPAGLSNDGDSVHLRMADTVFTADLAPLSGSSDVYTAVYLLSPDELRGEIYLLGKVMP